MTEHFDHAAIVQLSNCPETRESGARREQSEAVEQMRADALALEPVFDGHRNFGRLFVSSDVRACPHYGVFPCDDQGKLPQRIG